MRVVTRGDVDGLMCAALLKAAGVADTMLQAHPKDLQDGNAAISGDDIICNLPYAPGCAMWFDHHISEELAERQPTASFRGKYGIAPSAARLVYEYFLPEHPELQRFETLLQVVDRFDSANLTLRDVTDPEPAMLLAFLADPRTGLGYQHHFRISNKQFTDALPDLLITHEPAAILAMPDAAERVECYHRLHEEAAAFYRGHAKADGNILMLDLRGIATIPPVNRFWIYTLPGMADTNVSVRLSDVKATQGVSIQAAKNIFNRTSTVNLGKLMAEFGGGGHAGAGTCQVPADQADAVLAKILPIIRG